MNAQERRIRQLERALTDVSDTYLTDRDDRGTPQVVGVCWCSPSLSYDGHPHEPWCIQAQAALPMPVRYDEAVDAEADR